MINKVDLVNAILRRFFDENSGHCIELILYPRFGNGGVLPSWIDNGIWSMPHERYTHKGLRTDLGKIPSFLPFENLTTAFGP